MTMEEDNVLGNEKQSYARESGFGRGIRRHRTKENAIVGCIIVLSQGVVNVWIWVKGAEGKEKIIISWGPTVF